MIEFNTKINKGEHMQYILSNQAKDIVYNGFTNKKEADAFVFVAQEILSANERFIQDAVEARMDQIIYQTRVELSKEFPTKSDLKAIKEFLEKKILEVKLELSEKINAVDKKLARIEDKIGGSDQKIDSFERNLNQRIDSVEQNLNQKIDSVEHSLNQRIDSVEQNLNQKIDSVEHSLNQKIDSFERNLNQRIDSVISFLSEKISKEIALSTSTSIKWFIGTIVGIIAATSSMQILFHYLFK